jgi:hypothetical protein
MPRTCQSLYRLRATHAANFGGLNRDCAASLDFFQHSLPLWWLVLA